jgi:hypothetical protein
LSQYYWVESREECDHLGKRAKKTLEDKAHKEGVRGIYEDGLESNALNASI